MCPLFHFGDATERFLGRSFTCDVSHEHECRTWRYREDYRDDLKSVYYFLPKLASQCTGLQCCAARQYRVSVLFKAPLIIMSVVRH